MYIPFKHLKCNARQVIEPILKLMVSALSIWLSGNGTIRLFNIIKVMELSTFFHQSNFLFSHLL